jgi:EAL domain-containing protein (putative c-di-GMP-specific phosphodiesterase class I)
LKRAYAHALENNEFKLFYQAKVDLEERMVIGAEALFLWDSPTLRF